MAKSTTRILAEQIQSITGESLIYINSCAIEMIAMGLVNSREEALNEILWMVCL